MNSAPPALVRWCPSCHRDVEQFRPGPSGRPDATCPHCGAHERHRFLALLLEGLSPWLSGASVVLDVAPSRQMTKQLKRLCPRGYFSMDFDPAADGRPVDVRASMTDLPLPDASVDFMVCYHVLEHVPDDAAAMAEIARVLKPGGLALIQVPWRRGRDTDEDPSAPVEERVRRFGQADHVRYYGRDFEDRLMRGGLDVTRMTPLAVLGKRGCALMRLVEEEAVWAVRCAASGEGGVLVPHDGLAGGSTAFLVRLVLEERAQARSRESARARTAALTREVAGLRAQVETAHTQAAQQRSDAARWRAAYERLLGRRPVRAMVTVSRLVRRRRGFRQP